MLPSSILPNPPEKSSKSSRMVRTTKTKHFVLVHGGCLGAWSWYKVVTNLMSEGHKVTALDMAASGINPKTVEDIHSPVDYAEPLMEFMETLPEDERVILVGHGLGGACISLAMEKFTQKIAVAVFLAAFMPCLGFDMDSIYEKYKRPWEFYMDSKIKLGEDGKPVSFLLGPNYMAIMMFPRCTIEDVELALLLIRPEPIAATPESLEKDSNLLTKEKYGSVPRVYIKIERDNVINKPIEEFRLNNYPPEEVKIISEGDHVPMISNPQDLSSCLLEISQKYE